MKLLDLEAMFIRYESREPHAEALSLNPSAKVAHWIVPEASIDEAHGVQFLCPKAVAIHGKGHAHCVRLWFFGKPVDADVGRNAAGKVVRFRVVRGSVDLATLTLSPEVDEGDDLCGWTGAVKNGEASSVERQSSREKQLKKGARP